MTNLIRRIDTILGTVERVLIIVSAGLLVVLISIVTINRYFLGLPMPWYQEITRFAYMMLVFWGCSSLALTDEHLQASFLQEKLEGRWKWAHQLIIKSVFLVVSVIAVYFSYQLAIRDSSHTVYLRLPNRWIIFLTMVLGFTAMSFRLLQRLVGIIRAGVD